MYSTTEYLCYPQFIGIHEAKILSDENLESARECCKKFLKEKNLEKCSHEVIAHWCAVITLNNNQLREYFNNNRLKREVEIRKHWIEHTTHEIKKLELEISKSYSDIRKWNREIEKNKSKLEKPDSSVL